MQAFPSRTDRASLHDRFGRTISRLARLGGECLFRLFPSLLQQRATALVIRPCGGDPLLDLQFGLVLGLCGLLLQLLDLRLAFLGEFTRPLPRFSARAIARSTIDRIKRFSDRLPSLFDISISVIPRTSLKAARIVCFSAQANTVSSLVKTRSSPASLNLRFGGESRFPQ